MSLEFPSLRHLAFRAAAIAAGAALLLASCASPRPGPFRPVDARRAQVAAQNHGGRVRFDAVFARDAEGGAALDLYKGGIGPVAALRLTADGNASFLLRAQGRAWRGDRAQAPSSIAPLLEILSLYAREKELEDGEKEIRSPAGQVALEVRGGRIRSVAVASDSGEGALAVFEPDRSAPRQNP